MPQQGDLPLAVTSPTAAPAIRCFRPDGSPYLLQLGAIDGYVETENSAWIGVKMALSNQPILIVSTMQAMDEAIAVAMIGWRGTRRRLWQADDYFRPGHPEPVPGHVHLCRGPKLWCGRAIGDTRGHQLFRTEDAVTCGRCRRHLANPPVPQVALNRDNDPDSVHRQYDRQADE